MLGNKSVQIEQNVDAVLAEVKNVVVAIKSGKAIADIALEELLKLQGVVQAVQGSVGDVKESLPAAVRTVLLGAEDIALAVMGFAQ